MNYFSEFDYEFTHDDDDLEIENPKARISEYCDLHDAYVKSVKFYDCANRDCRLHLCDGCYQNRKKHGCILV